MDLNFFKDILFDYLNEWPVHILDVFVNDKDDLIWVVMGDGSVFRIHCEKETFHLYKPPKSHE